MTLNAAQVNPRIKATVTSAMYDITRNGWMDSRTAEDRRTGLDTSQPGAGRTWTPANRPILLITGGHASLRCFSDTLYDRIGLIPFAM